MQASTTAVEKVTVELSAAEQQGMRDFYDEQLAREPELTAGLMKVVEKMPALQAVMRRMKPEELAERQARSREMMRLACVESDWGPLRADQRQQGSMYAAMGVGFGEWFQIISPYQGAITPFLIAKFHHDPERLAGALVAMSRYIDLAMSTIGDEYLKTKERIIAQQAAAIQELSTPVLQLRDRLLLVPLVGVLDSQRARSLTEQLLASIRAHRAKVVVMDITGVGAVDSKVANHLFQTVAAARLMGARTVITGLTAEVAQALVALGIDVEKLNAVGDLQGGLEEAERLIGVRTVAAGAV